MAKILSSTLFLILLTSCANTQSSSQSSPGQAFDMTAQCTTGATRQGYLTPTTNGDFPCAPSTQTCVNGVWQGPQLYDSCSNFTKSCEGTPHGGTEYGYTAPVAPRGMPCMPTARTCIDGQWSTPFIYKHCSEEH